VWNAESMQAVLGAAQRRRSPVILMCGPGEFPLLDAEAMAAVAHALIGRYSIPAVLHLDHGNSLEMVHRCLKAGFTSVMLDFSTRPFAENADALKKVAAASRPLGVTVEGEIGAVGKVDSSTVEGTRECRLTDPQEARAYVETSGVDALAVAIGNAHGLYTRLPVFDFDRLAAIRECVPVPLVLHGGSGTPDAELRRAISLGITKVNVASDLVHAVRGSLLNQWNACRNTWTPGALAEATEALVPVVERWIDRLGAAGNA
jgi:ketose-bisphosphate aldolase